MPAVRSSGPTVHCCAAGSVAQCASASVRLLKPVHCEKAHGASGGGGGMGGGEGSPSGGDEGGGEGGGGEGGGLGGGGEGGSQNPTSDSVCVAKVVAGTSFLGS